MKSCCLQQSPPPPALPPPPQLLLLLSENKAAHAELKTNKMDHPWNEGRYCRVRLVPQQNGERILTSENNYDPNTQPSVYPIPIPVNAQPQNSRENVQVFRIAPRAVYNLQMDGRGEATRRGSVDSGLTRVVRYGSAGPDCGPTRVIRIGPSTGGNSLEGNRAPRVIRMGPGYNDSTSQVFHIANAPGGVPQSVGPNGRLMQEYHTRRGNPNTALHIAQDSNPYQTAVEDPTTGRMYYDLTNQPELTQEASQTSVGSPRIIRITPRFVQSFSTASPQSAGTLGNHQPSFSPQVHTESPRVNFSQQEQTNSPKVVHYRMSSQGHPLSSEWQSVTASPGNYSGASNSPSGQYPWRDARTTQTANYPPEELTATDNSVGRALPIHLGEIGKSNSTEETFLLGPNGRRRVSVQMIGKGAGARRGSIPIYSSEVQAQTGFNDGRVPLQNAAPPTRTVRVAAPPAGPDNSQLNDFDRIIKESIQQFMMQRQPYENPNAPWRTSASVWHKINEAEGAQNPQPPVSGLNAGVTESPDRNLFKNCQFQFRSIGNPSGSNRAEDGGANSGGSDNESGTGSGKWNRRGARISANNQPGAPVAIFFFNDFDDMIARMRELKEGSGGGVNRLTPNVITSSSCVEANTNPPEEARVTGNYETISEPTARVATLNRREADVDSGYDSLDGPNKHALLGKSGTFRPQMTLAKNVRWPNREALRQKIELFNQNALGLIVSLDQFTESFDGFLRVTMNLIRPVQMSSGTADQLPNPAAAAAGAAAGDELARAGYHSEPATTTFYLPKDTSKVIHITSNTKTKEVIRSLLSKFLIKDNPMKFALYENIRNPGTAEKMRRLGDDELPLALCLSWIDEGLEGLTSHEFVLQENDTGEILWEAFSLPELENFLLMLNKEAEEYIKQVKTTYRLLKIQLHKRLKQLKRDSATGMMVTLPSSVEIVE